MKKSQKMEIIFRGVSVLINTDFIVSVESSKDVYRAIVEEIKTEPELEIVKHATYEFCTFPEAWKVADEIMEKYGR